MSTASSDEYFLVLCSEDRQETYQTYLENDPHTVEYVTSVNDLLARSIVEPPLALLVDVRTKIRLGTRETNIIDNLQVDWPILRGRTMSEGIQASCTKPNHSGDLEQCLADIRSNPDNWRSSRAQRRHLRLVFEFRVRLRQPGGEWRLGNTTDISTAGMSLVTYEQFDRSDEIELELWDLTEEPISMHGVVSWTKPWDAGPALPLVGVAFDSTTVTDEMKAAITREEIIARFRRNFR